ncbi:MAG: aminotransferase class I/II-fold pyridoxal phosphate-dependent enzyme, partial [Pseudomonas neustonica]
LGWLVAPREAVPALEKLAQNLYICAPHMAQQAALAAFNEQSREICEVRREAFQARRDFLLPALRQLGFSIPVTPQGAFYLYADMQALGGDSQQLCQHVIDTEFLALTPGLDFGQYRADQHLRFAYTTSLERLEQGVERLARALQSWPAC